MAWITKEKRLAIYLRDGFKCAYCATDLADATPAEITLDHLICRCNGGGNEETNLVTSCRWCNCTDKHMKDWTEYADAKTQRRIKRLLKKPLNTKLAAALIEGTAG